jgi:hypothetical protein
MKSLEKDLTYHKLKININGVGAKLKSDELII